MKEQRMAMGSGIRQVNGVPQRRIAALLVGLSGAAMLWSVLACGGTGWVFLDDDLMLNELGDGDLEVVCEADSSGYAQCSGGYRAGFVSSEVCVEVLRDLRDEGGFICDRQTVGELRACFKMSACERATTTECEQLLRCVLRRNAERDGSPQPFY